MFSVQAIALSTRIAHNLGQSDLNATLGGAAIRIAHCLGIHQIDAEDDILAVDTAEGWYSIVEIEVGRRCWLQLVIQDYFQIPFTNAHRKLLYFTYPNVWNKLTVCSRQPLALQHWVSYKLP